MSAVCCQRRPVLYTRLFQPPLGSSSSPVLCKQVSTTYILWAKSRPSSQEWFVYFEIVRSKSKEDYFGKYGNHTNVTFQCASVMFHGTAATFTLFRLSYSCLWVSTASCSGCKRSSLVCRVRCARSDVEGPGPEPSAEEAGTLGILPRMSTGLSHSWVPAWRQQSCMRGTQVPATEMSPLPSLLLSAVPVPSKSRSVSLKINTIAAFLLYE